MTDFDQRRIQHWIGDAFTLLCVRSASASQYEKKLRLGFEVILRNLGTSPLQIIATSVLPPCRLVSASKSDLRRILLALDRCLALYQRYDALLDAAQRRICGLVETTRHFALQELRRLEARVEPEFAEAAH